MTVALFFFRKNHSGHILRNSLIKHNGSTFISQSHQFFHCFIRNILRRRNKDGFICSTGRYNHFFLNISFKKLLVRNHIPRITILC